MKQFLLYLSFITFGTTLSIAQDNTIIWQNTIGGSNNDFIDFIDTSSDGGYIVGAHSTSNISGDKTEDAIGLADYWIIKLNENGEVDWENTIGGTEEERLRAIQQTSDGGYIVGGYSESGISGDKTEESNGGADYWVIKLDVNGAIEWQNAIGGSGDDLLRAVYQTSDGGYIVGGYSNSNASGDKTEDSIGEEDYWVVKLNANGEVEWENTVGGNLSDSLYDVKETTDGGYILGGGSFSSISGDKTEDPIGIWDDYWIVKLDSQGVVLWDNTIGGTSTDELRSIEETMDGGFLLSGYSLSGEGGDKTEPSFGNFDYWVIKVNNLGIIEWDNTLGGSDEDAAYFGRQLDDGSYIITGNSKSNISGDKTEDSFANSLDYWIVNLAEDGSLNWENTIGANGNEYINSSNVIQLANGNLVFGGFSESDISGDKTENSQGELDLWILEVSGDPSLTVNDNEQTNQFSVFPNPTNGDLTIFGINTIASDLKVSNLLGETIKSYNNVPGVISITDLPSGVYFLTIETDGQILTRKIIKR